MSVAALSRTVEGLRDVYGRGMNLHSDVYKLPADAEEHDRLTMQHRIWKLMLGGEGLYPPDVEETVAALLSPNRSPNTNGESAPSPSVLDLGSGSGIWVAEMAAMYPHAMVVGLDLTEPKLQGSFPSNCSFVTTDLTKGLDEYRDSFDVVHCRCVAGHLVDRGQLLREIAKVLKPGGLLLLGDGNLHLYNLDGSYVPLASLDTDNTRSLGLSPDSSEANASEGSWMARWLTEVIGRLLAATLDPEHAGGEHIGWLVRSEPALEYIDERAYFSPLRPRPGNESERELELARLSRRNMLNYLTASKPILLANDVPEDIVDDWLRRARAEVTESPMCWAMKWDMAWATKRREAAMICTAPLKKPRL